MKMPRSKLLPFHFKLLQGFGEDYGGLLSKGTFREVDWPFCEAEWLSISSLDPALA